MLSYRVVSPALLIGTPKNPRLRSRHHRLGTTHTRQDVLVDKRPHSLTDRLFNL